MRFENSLCFAKGCSHEYDDRFDKIGDTYTLREGTRFVANDGADITSLIQDVKEPSRTLTIDTRKNVAFQFTSKDLTLSIDRFSERYLDAASIALANKFEVDGLTLAKNSTFNTVGTAGTTPATAAVVLAAGRKLDEFSAPMDGNRSLVVNPAAQASVVDAFKGLFNASSEVGKQYRSGKMGTAFGFEWAMSQNVPTHTVGTWAGGALINDASFDAASDTAMSQSIAVDDLTASATIKKGDKFTIAGVYAVNPVSGVAYDYLQQFTVLADATASGAGEIAALSVYPPLRDSGAQKTVSALPADDAALTPVGTGGSSYPMNIAHHKQAFVFATVPLVVPQGVHMGKTVVNKDTGVSLRMISDYNVLTDVFVTRVDIAYGWAARRPEWASVIIG